jgi:glutamate 5-kinase
VGVTSVSGEFDRGDTISVLNTDGSELARGLTSYQASEMTKIAGRQSREIEPILGYAYGEEVIHRDQLVLLARQEDKPT